MADFKKHMVERLQSARHWLLRAEESFDKERDIRGELDLLLAQAELQHVKEEHRSRQWRYKYPLLRHGLAICLALTAGVIGTGGVYWWQNQAAQSVPVPAVIRQGAGRTELTAQSGNSKAAAHPQTNIAEEPAPLEISSRTAEEPAKTQQIIPPVAKSHAEPRPAAPEKQEQTISPDEMQKLVRVAGKSLRGQ